MLPKCSLLFILRIDLCKSESSKRSKYISHFMVILTGLKILIQHKVWGDSLNDLLYWSISYLWFCRGCKKRAVLWNTIIAYTIHQYPVFSFMSIINSFKFNLNFINLFAILHMDFCFRKTLNRVK